MISFWKKIISFIKNICLLAVDLVTIKQKLNDIYINIHFLFLKSSAILDNSIS